LEGWRRHHKLTVFSIGRSLLQRWQIAAITSWRWSSKGRGRPGLEVNEALDYYSDLFGLNKLVKECTKRSNNHKELLNALKE
jgi:hypothetical protein